MKKLPLTFLIILFTLTSNVVWSADYNKGWNAYESGDYATALLEFKPLAEQGNDDAQFYMGLMYLNGYGVPEDFNVALKWYTLSAEQGYKFAHYNMSEIYENGWGVLQDNICAYMWGNIAVFNGIEKGAEIKDRVVKNMTSDDISEAQELARECMAKNYKGCETCEKYVLPTIRE